jgi:hypothetical protein
MDAGMAHQPGPGGLPLLDRVLVRLLRLAWRLPTRWQQAERHTVAMQTSSDPTLRVREARAALAAFQAAERHHPSRRRREAHLPSMAAAALEAGELDAAAAYAQQMLAAGMGPRGQDWNAGNLIHHGHITLGRLALLAGDTDGAAQHLLRAGSTPGSPQRTPSGPTSALPTNCSPTAGRTRSRSTCDAANGSGRPAATGCNGGSLRSTPAITPPWIHNYQASSAA